MTNTTHPGCNQYGHAPGCGHVKDETGLDLASGISGAAGTRRFSDAEQAQVHDIETLLWTVRARIGSTPITHRMPDGGEVTVEIGPDAAVDQAGHPLEGGYKVSWPAVNGSVQTDYYAFGYRRHMGDRDPLVSGMDAYEHGAYRVLPGGVSGIGVVCDGPVVARRVAEDVVRRAPLHIEELSEDDFDEQFGHIEAPDGNSVWEDRPTQYPENRVWTVVDVDGDLYLEPGYHVVNKVGYVVSEKPRDHENYTAEWFVSHDEDEWDEEEG